MHESIRPTILVVDDSEFNRALLHKLLSADYNVLTAEDGGQGLAIARNQLPDLIFLDIIMPGLDGFAICQTLKTDNATTDIPIIFITSMDAPQDIQKGFATGAVDYITKPFNGAEVMARTKTHLSLKAAGEDLKQQNAILKKTIEEQELNIALARNILDFISNYPARYIRIGEGFALCFHAFSSPCKTEGGDHLFARKLMPNPNYPRGRTVISLKDQSGHAVNCMLRSIISDLTHNVLLNFQHLSLEKIVSTLNHTLCKTKLFKDDQFFTSITAEIDHNTLLLNFVSCGHPPFFLIRQNVVTGYPQPGGGGNNLPMGIIDQAEFKAGQLQLMPGDKLILYTDGLPEMPLRNEQQILSYYELKDVLTELVHKTPLLPVADLAEQLISHIANLCNEEVSATHNTSNDDITVLGVELENTNDVTEMELLPDDFQDIDDLISFAWTQISQELIRHDYENSDYKIQTALTEAILNAWKHGNKRNCSLPITVRWRFGNDFTLEIIDRGRGFNYRDLPNPTDLDHLLAESGRGIFIIKKLSSYTKWKSSGSHLIITFQKTRMNSHKPPSETNEKFNLWGTMLKH
ncbi:MAG: response regulator [Desulfobulbaceae bacterium]|nr:response regulator [Desulfobulbaceae bacterium]HIJ78414.1 response regulator [Deltaproteobacteria bacterium]